MLRETDDEALIQFDTTEPMLLLAASEAGLPIEPPVRIRDGEAALDVTAPHDRRSASDWRASGWTIPLNTSTTRSIPRRC